MPKFNMYQSLHTTVIGPEGLPLEIQIRTREMHDMAEFGVAAHWIYKQRPAAAGASRPRGRGQAASWLRSMLDWQQELSDPKEFMENLKVDLFDEEVFVFTPKGEVKSLAAGRDAAGLRLRGPHRDRPPLRRREGQRQDRPAALRAEVRRHRRGPHRQARARPVARLAGGRQDDPRAQQDQAVVQGRVARGHRARRPRAAAGAPAARPACRRRRSPARRCSPTSSARWASARPTTSTSRSAARRSRRRSSSTRSCSASSRARRPRSETAVAETLVTDRAASAASRPARRTRTASGSRASTTSCCAWPSAAARCPATRSSATSRSGAASRSTATTARTPPRCARTPSASSASTGRATTSTSFKVELQVDAWDRHRLLEDLSRTFSEARHQHRRGALHRATADGPEPLRRRGRRHAGAEGDGRPPAQHRRRLRRLPRHAGRRLSAQLTTRQRAGRRPRSARGRRGRCSRRRPGAANGAPSAERTSTPSTPAKPLDVRGGRRPRGRRRDRRAHASSACRRARAPQHRAGERAVVEADALADADRALAEVGVRVAVLDDRPSRRATVPPATRPSIRGGRTT